jgi:hydrogenase assembly chaperone HypC/HupF
MCLSVPGRVIGLVEGNDQLAVVDVAGAPRRVNVAMLECPPALGDWLVVHAGFALERVDEAEAERALASLELLGRGEDTELLYRTFGTAQRNSTGG